MSDHRLSRAYARQKAGCDLAFRKLEQNPSARFSVLELVAKWEALNPNGRWYVERWRQILDMPVNQARAIVMADNDEGAMLRHHHPFAAVFNNRERRALMELRHDSSST
jgi:hypothetical protein